MKKKSFFNGYNAKLALAVVALSGALLTGCYKDDGLDVNGPAGEITLPEPVYTIAGNVLDAETLKPIAEAAVSGDATATVVNGGFSVDVKDPKSYNLTVKAAGYMDATVAVDVKKINAGQSAVYTTLVAMQPKYDGKYTLNVVDSELGALAAADWKVTTLAGEAVSSPYEGGQTYLITITKEGYVVKYVTVELPKTRTDVEKVINVTLTKQVIGKVKIYGELSLNGQLYNAKSIKLKNSKGNLLGVDEGYTYNFEVPATEFEVVTRAASETKTATFTFEIVDPNNVKMSFNKTFTIKVTPDGSIEEGDSEVEAPIEFKVNVEPDDLGVVNAWDDVYVMTVDICNDSDREPLPFTFEYRDYTGAESVVAESDYVNKLNEAGLKSGELYESIVDLMTINEEKFTSTLKEGKQEVPVQKLLKTMKIVHKYAKVVYTLKDITVDGAVVSEFEKAYGAKNTLKEAAKTDFDVTDLYDISHSHGHGHGHGDNQNAGGGMVEAE